jgi:hypothetical protein
MIDVSPGKLHQIFSGDSKCVRIFWESLLKQMPFINQPIKAMIRNLSCLTLRREGLMHCSREEIPKCLKGIADTLLIPQNILELVIDIMCCSPEDLFKVKDSKVDKVDGIKFDLNRLATLTELFGAPI